MKTSRSRGLRVALLLLGVAAAIPAAGQLTLISTGAVWKYYAQGGLTEGGWKTTNFNSDAWQQGPAPLGYGEGDEATSLDFDGQPRPLTTYYRYEFVLPNPTGIIEPSTKLRLMRDDAAVVYVNGFEVFRSNLPVGAIDPLTPAQTREEGLADLEFRSRTLSSYILRPGTNAVAVEVHQHPDGMADSRFDLEMVANLPLTLPEISILSPDDGDIMLPGDIRITVRTSDLDGYVYWVRYVANGMPIGNSFEEPFTFVWPAVSPGRYRITAEAVDNSGRSRASAPVHLQVGLEASTQITRGPYLQSGSSTGMVVCWRTDWVTDSVVRYGTVPTGLNQVAQGASGIDHVVRLTGLAPGTRYFYAVGTSDGTLPGGGGLGHSFVTATLEKRPTRIWAIGDSGSANAYAAAVRDAYLNATEQTDVWLMLGDNAYETGTDDQYQAAVFRTYDRLLPQVCLWPTIGNHDTGAPGLTEEIPYLEIFHLPRNGEAGGLASGTERYYSFDQANVHFVCLDSMAPSISPGSPMLTWLENDLAATSQDWIIAFWHHPPYSWGTHNSDFELRLMDMRGHVLPILERHGVDLVLTGHSHVYERSFLLNGHYGLSATLKPEMVLNAGLGRPQADGPYRKPSGGLGANQGCIYVVCGCSGEGGDFEFPRHPAMAVNRAGFGSMIIDVNGSHMDVHFLTEEGAISDWFAIDKAGQSPTVRPRLNIRQVDGGIELAWPTSEMEFHLESAPGIGTSVPWDWDAVPSPTSVFGRQHRAQLEAVGTNRVFRLRADP